MNSAHCTQLLYELADAEVKAGRADGALMGDALREANGSAGYAQQIYLRLRVAQWSAEMAPMPEEQRNFFLRELAWTCQVAAKASASRNNRQSWLWAALCGVAACSAAIASYYFAGTIIARRAYAWIYSAVFFASIVISFVALAKSRRLMGRDPFD